MVNPLITNLNRPTALIAPVAFAHRGHTMPQPRGSGDYTVLSTDTQAFPFQHFLDSLNETIKKRKDHLLSKVYRKCGYCIIVARS